MFLKPHSRLRLHAMMFSDQVPFNPGYSAMAMPAHANARQRIDASAANLTCSRPLPQRHAAVGGLVIAGRMIGMLRRRAVVCRTRRAPLWKPASVYPCSGGLLEDRNPGRDGAAIWWCNGRARKPSISLVFTPRPLPVHPSSPTVACALASAGRDRGPIMRGQILMAHPPACRRCRDANVTKTTHSPAAHGGVGVSVAS